MLSSFLFWSAWIIIPLLMEIIPAIGACIMVLVRGRRGRKREEREKSGFQPELTIIVPVYNSADTLRRCVDSIAESDYPADRIRVFLVNNRSTDDSFRVFQACQAAWPGLHLQWMNAEQGKSRALNLALYNAAGKYIINIDADGMLEKHALQHLARHFEENPEINIMTGTVLTKPEEIRRYRHFFPRLLRNCEFMEYAQDFLVGRAFSSQHDTVYTMSGAFSAFRKSAVLKSRLYNTETISEDTQMTFQMRYLQHERVYSCVDAIYFVGPVESFNKLYVQRQRWQRGALEVARMFDGGNFRLRKFFTDPNIHTLVYDHTFAFPRLIWYLALILLTWLNYSGRTVLLAFGLILLLYILSGYLYFFSGLRSLRISPPTRRYYRNHWWVVAVLPFYNLLVFFIRFAGIINSIGTDSEWRTRDLSDEGQAFRQVVRADAEEVRRGFGSVNRVLNLDRVLLNRHPGRVRRLRRRTMQGTAVLLTAALLLGAVLLLRGGMLSSVDEKITGETLTAATATTTTKSSAAVLPVSRTVIATWNG